MLKGTRQARDKIVGKMRPTAFREFWEFDVEKVAVNAVNSRLELDTNTSAAPAEHGRRTAGS